MSGDTPITVNPPPGEAPGVLQLIAEQVMPNADGTFTVKAKYLATLLSNGWSVVVQSGTTHVP